MSERAASGNKNRKAFTSKNPCNEFLVEHLIRVRQGEARLGRGRHKSDHQFQLYTRVIDSIRKYPLPIICEEQLAMLAGVGDFMVGKLTSVIK